MDPEFGRCPSPLWCIVAARRVLTLSQSCVDVWLSAQLKLMYHQLVITASSPHTQVWLGDDEGHLVQRAVGELRTSVLAGSYVVEFELGGPTYPIRLEKPSAFTQRELEAGPTCPRPIPQIDDDDP